MPNDAHQKKILADGVHQKDYRTHTQRFQKCPACNDIFSLKIIPNLLKCGHFYCNPCTKQNRPCVFCKCPRQLKIKGYKELLEVEPQKQKEAAEEVGKYDIIIQIPAKGKSKPMQGVLESTKMEAILEQFIDFKGFQKELGENTGICIQSKTAFSYSKIKDKPLSYFKESLRRQTCNMIVILDRFRGGVKQ